MTDDFPKFDCPVCDGQKYTTAFVCGVNAGGIQQRPCETCKGTGWLTDSEMGVYRLKKAKREERRDARLARNLSMREMAKAIGNSGITKTVNRMLIGAMAERGMSRSDMSRALEASRETVTIALNDEHRDWKICTLEEWADALNCDLVIKLQARQDEPEPR